MWLELKNILKIKEAHIEIGGLTVITGENNTGKTTVGKILFSMLKALNHVRRLDQAKVELTISKELRSLHRMVRFRDEFNPSLEEITEIARDLARGVLEYDDFRREITKHLLPAEISPRQAAILSSSLDNIKRHLDSLNNPEAALKSEFDSIVKSEFNEPLTSFGKAESVIKFHDETTDASGSDITINVAEGAIENIDVWGYPSLEDVTLIESPVFLPILNVLKTSSAISSPSLRQLATTYFRESVPFHLADMAEKLLSPASVSDTLFFDKEKWEKILSKISETIDGKIEIDPRNRQLYYVRKDQRIPILSVASGIKSFGVLQRLIQTENLSAFQLLIWDEPEIHLHPEWQIAFCKLIVELVAAGIPIVLSTHSPYFVQAIRYFAAERNLEKEVRYYMAEDAETSDLTSIREVTEDLNEVFKLLASPLHKIMNVDAVRGKNSE